jgi:3-dehydroquinate synthase
MLESIRVSLGSRAYDVHIGAGLLARAGALIAPFASSGRIFLVSDTNVWRNHGDTLARALSSSGLGIAARVELTPGEEAKSFGELAALCSTLLQAGISRRDLVIAFGGGVVGDLAGLAAGLVLRGVDFVQVPTTLLAQVDSSVGGKTAIDMPEGKNLVGLIHQPKLVLADLDVLATLPAREMACGYAEIVKVGLIGDAEFFSWCEANAAAVLAREPQALHDAIERAVAFKAGIVEADEREAGLRALLNLGHTFGHALEASAGFGEALKHGEAVAAGMALAFQFSARQGLCAEADAARVVANLEASGFTTDLMRLPGGPFDAERLLALMAADKKADAGRLTFILARGVGEAFVAKDVDVHAVRAFLKDQLAP